MSSPTGNKRTIKKYSNRELPPIPVQQPTYQNQPTGLNKTLKQPTYQNLQTQEYENLKTNQPTAQKTEPYNVNNEPIYEQIEEEPSEKTNIYGRTQPATYQNLPSGQVAKSGLATQQQKPATYQNLPSGQIIKSALRTQQQQNTQNPVPAIRTAKRVTVVSPHQINNDAIELGRTADQFIEYNNILRNRRSNLRYSRKTNMYDLNNANYKNAEIYGYGTLSLSRVLNIIQEDQQIYPKIEIDAPASIIDDAIEILSKDPAEQQIFINTYNEIMNMV